MTKPKEESKAKPELDEEQLKPVAKKATKSVVEIDDLDEEDFRDAKSIIELLKENLTLWKEEEEGGDNNIEDM